MELLYFVIAFFATFIGAISGFGGGIIIKPSLDAVGQYDAATITMLSTMTVLAMSSVSSAKYLRHKVAIDKKIGAVLFGAVAGGFVGKSLFSLLLIITGDSNAKHLQSIFLILLLVVVLFKNRFPMINVISLPIAGIVGVMLGTVSTFLGIGGGPFNVAVLCMLFPITMKDAGAYSLYSIFLSSASSILLTLATTGFSSYNLSMLIFMVPAAVCGGFIGSIVNRKANHALINVIYYILCSGLVLLNMYNLVRK